MRTAGVGGASSGALAALSLPPFGFWPLLFVAFLPLLRALSNPTLDQRGAAIEGIFFGALFFGLLLHWIPFTLRGMIPLGLLSGGVALLLLTGTAGIQGVLLHTLLVRRRIPPLLALPIVWAGSEYLLAHAGPLAFPWTPLALGFASVPDLASISEIAGIQGVTVWVTAVNGAVAGIFLGRSGSDRHLAPYHASLRPSSRTPLPPSRNLLPHTARAVALAILLVLPAAWGVFRTRTLPVHELPEILLVQLEVPRDQLLDRSRRGAAVQSGLARAIGEERALQTDGSRGLRVRAAPLFALLPEAPFGAPLDWIMERSLGMSSTALGAPLILGMHLPEEWSETGLPFSGPPEGWTPSQPGSQMSEPVGHQRNAVLFLSPGEPLRLLHTKSRLVPGVETSGLASGPRGGVFELRGLRTGILICFEVAFPSEGRRLRNAGAELLLNPSNDGWFAPRFGGWRSAAHAQHRAHLVLRAIESRMGAARSSLGGEALLIDPTGEVTANLPAGEEGFVQVRPRTSSLKTGFVRFGDLAGVGTALLLLVLLGWRKER
jgi:apolipoprotein N-acyltransferase